VLKFVKKHKRYSPK